MMTWKIPVNTLSISLHKTSESKDTAMQIEKAQINDRLRVLKVSWKLRIPTINNFE